MNRPAGWNDWRWQLAHAWRPEESDVSRRFPALATPYYASLADWSNPADPIARQILPDARELETAGGESPDPFSEHADACVAPGLTRRFEDRLLVMVQTACSTYCRHCTRKHLLAHARTASLEDALAFLRDAPAIREVLLSGGDPLMGSDEEILAWVDALSALPQLDAIRLCTRMPAVLPMRITPELTHALGRSKRLWVNTQFNHPREITPESTAACARLVEAGIPVSNQTVLLRGINDDADTLVALCAGLERIRVRPYYVFLCDPVSGLAHFRTSRETARELQTALRRRLGGLAVPRVVVDRPGACFKESV